MKKIVSFVLVVGFMMSMAVQAKMYKSKDEDHPCRVELDTYCIKELQNTDDLSLKIACKDCLLTLKAETPEKMSAECLEILVKFDKKK